MLILIRCCCYTKTRAKGLISLGLFPFVILEKLFYYSILFYWFLLLFLLNNFRNLFIFCIRGFPFVILEKVFWFLPLILFNNCRNLFIFCININIDELLLLDQNKNLGINFFRVNFLCNS